MLHPDFIKSECCQCAGHLEFPASAIGETVICPHCQKSTQLLGVDGAPEINQPKIKSHNRRFLVISALLLLMFLLIWLRKQPTVVVAENPLITNAVVAVKALPPDEIQTNNFAIATIQLEKTPGNSLVYVTGKLRNLTPQQRFGVKLEFDLFSASASVVGQAKDYQAVLEPNGVWNFKALVLDAKATSAKFRSVQEDK